MFSNDYNCGEIEEHIRPFIATMNVKDCPKDRLVPVISYVIADTETVISLTASLNLFFESQQINKNKKKKQLGMLEK